jgi:hypothetical protein
VWIVDPTDQPVIPATDTVSFSVVVTNLGNVVSVAEPIDLTLSGPSDPVVLTELVPALEPGAQTTVRFEDLEVDEGASYEVVAELKVLSDDLDFEDNMLRVLFSVNEDEAG